MLGRIGIRGERVSKKIHVVKSYIREDVVRSYDRPRPEGTKHKEGEG